MKQISPFELNWNWDWDWSVFLHPDSFSWQVGVTPLSDPSFILVTWLIYGTTILSIKFIVAKVFPSFLKRVQKSIPMLSAIHNLILCVWSALMFVFALLETRNRAMSRGIGEIFCTSDLSQSSTSGRLYFVTYIYYVSKFYELFDTVILALKLKKIIFLHWYHHAIVILMVWSWLTDYSLFSNIGLMFNTFVHVFMYYYYFQTAIGNTVWFKKYITSTQIIQFMTSFVLSFPYLYFHFSKKCPTGMWSFIFSMVLNGSFLMLFIQFYKSSYSSKPKTVKKQQ